MSTGKSNLSLFGISLLAALILSIIFLPRWAIWLRPSWVLLVFCYFAAQLEDRVSIFAIFIVGIILDVLSGTLLGEQALALLCSIFFLIRFYPRTRWLLLWQQMGIVFLVSLVHLGILYLSQVFTVKLIENWIFFVPAIINTLCWPWMKMLLDRFYRA